ncbi:hypothetical protein [Caulobacter hibisci]|uniref:Uncharacterized protein n=1 Tax=Caulobacter hibisci TaxID=2035993 RepID=A0ABS0T7E7_9CAUL|nr:hypothetical protein [Caulobacter hibisci]MBI1686803.1 hypothetical protein [Caulobacter hibisci]
MGDSKRKVRRDRGRAKEDAALRRRYPDHRFFKGPARLAANDRDLRGTLDELKRFETFASAADLPVLLDLYETNHIDVVACVLLASSMQRCRLTHGLQIDVRMPRNGSARFALAAFGVVADDDRFDEDALQGISPQVMKVTSGMKGEPSPGARTFKVAKLAEGLVADLTLADRVHAALNEAADNVLSWAYGGEGHTPDPAERWWVAGLLTNKGATFIALDHGAGIPATAPQKLGDGLQGYLKSMIQEKDWRPINAKPSDSQILRATIHQRRTVSGLGERGKGLTNMIALIDLFPSGFISIFSGDAYYGYRTPAKDGEQEHCGPLGFQFPGTLIIWQLEARTSEARS